MGDDRLTGHRRRHARSRGGHVRVGAFREQLRPCRRPRRPGGGERDIYVAPGDIGFWQGALRDPAAAEFAMVTAAAAAGEPLTLSLLYGDFEGGQRVISQFAIRCGEGVWLTATGRHFNVDRPDPR